MARPNDRQREAMTELCRYIQGEHERQRQERVPFVRMRNDRVDSLEEWRRLAGPMVHGPGWRGTDGSNAGAERGPHRGRTAAGGASNHREMVPGVRGLGQVTVDQSVMPGVY